MNIKLVENRGSGEAVIKVIGVGGGGGNALNRMVECPVRGVELIALNTDTQALRKNRAPIKVQIGAEITRGLGVGGDPSKGKASAEESSESIRQVTREVDMVFITAGMGGGTGTGAAPVVAQIARENPETVVVGIVTKPFSFEGELKMRLAEEGIDEMKKYVDCILVIPNDKLRETLPSDIGAEEAFSAADNILVQAIKGITEVIRSEGVVNVDFADIKSIMRNSKNALIGVGLANGDMRHMEAMKQAIKSPLLENANIQNATGIIANFTASKTLLKLVEMEEAMDYVKKIVGNDSVKVKFGKVYEENMGDNLQITLISTGFPDRGYGFDFPGRMKISRKEPELVQRDFISPGLDEEFAKPAYLVKKRRILD